MKTDEEILKEVLSTNPERTEAIKKAISLTRQEATEEIQKKVFDEIDKLGEIRGKNNELIFITFGENYSTNSIIMLKEELKQSLQNIFNSNSPTKDEIAAVNSELKNSRRGSLSNASSGVASQKADIRDSSYGEQPSEESSDAQEVSK